jgi:hypothetical protein
VTDQALRLFRERVDSNDLVDTRISYRVVGGMPDEPGLPPLPSPDEVLTIDGRGAARVVTAGRALGEAQLEADDVARVFERVRSNLPRMVTRAEARFVPDSVVGEITLDVEGEMVQVYFPLEEDAQPGEPSLTGTIGDLHSSLSEIAARVRPEG